MMLPASPYSSLPSSVYDKFEVLDLSFKFPYPGFDLTQQRLDIRVTFTCFVTYANVNYKKEPPIAPFLYRIFGRADPDYHPEL